MSSVEFETPAALLGRLKLGREEALQRLLTCLIVHGPYPKWNSRNRPSPAGLAFLAALYDRHFDGGWPGDDVIFVDEFEMLPEHDDERGGAPDYALLWDDRLWLIELKSERASHRADQIPSYFRLAHHHYPAAAVDVLYLTPAMDAPYDPMAPWARYAHTTWAEVADLIRQVWPVGTDIGQQDVIDGLLDGIAMLHLTPSEWRIRVTGDAVDAASLPTTVPPPEADKPVEPASPAQSSLAAALDEALASAALTAEDGKQRAIEYAAPSYEALLELGLLVRDALAATPPGSPLRHVEVWRWRQESWGQPLTAAGREHGVELRLSRHAKPLYR